MAQPRAWLVIEMPSSASAILMLSAVNRAGSVWLTPDAVRLAILTLNGGAEVVSAAISLIVKVRLDVERGFAVARPGACCADLREGRFDLIFDLVLQIEIEAEIAGGRDEEGATCAEQDFLHAVNSGSCRE